MIWSLISGGNVTFPGPSTTRNFAMVSGSSLLLRTFGWGAGIGTPTVTYNGVSLVHLAGANSNGMACHFFLLERAGDGAAHDMVMTWGISPDRIAFWVDEFIGARSFHDATATTGTSTTPSVAVSNTTQVGDTVFDASLSDANSATVGAGQIEDLNVDFDRLALQSHRASAGQSTTMQWTLDVSTPWISAALAVAPFVPSVQRFFLGLRLSIGR